MTLQARYWWVFAIYFVEGLPFGVFADAMPVYFRMHGLSLHDIGVVSTLQLPWSLKVFWGPLVDRWGTPKQWICAALCALVAVHGALAAYAHSGPPHWGWALGSILLALAFSSATQDIAIDGYFVRLMHPGEEGFGNGLRVAAYRAALIVGGGGTVMLVGTVPWWQIFLVLAAFFAILALLLTRSPAVPKPPPTPWADWGRVLWHWVQKPGAAGVFAFILLYKLGDASMAAMVKPFWVDLGMSPAQIGLINTSFGIAVTIFGAIAGGWYTNRAGIYRSLWVLGLSQAFSNLGYAAVAYRPTGLGPLVAASIFENFTQGLGTAAQLALLTRLCDKEHAATQFAALTAMFGLTRAVAGVTSGWGAESLGYAHFFMLTFFLSFPAYLFLPYVKSRLAQVES